MVHNRPLSLTLALAVATWACGAVAQAHTDLTPAQVETRILQGGDLVILDVREYSEFCGTNEHIADAVNLPWNSGVLQLRYTELPASFDIIVLCASGGRSNAAANFLDGEGFPSVFDMLGGMGAWTGDREACGAQPGLVMYRSAEGTESDWIPAVGVQDYDLMRGEEANVAPVGGEIDLGIVDCLQKASPFTFYTDRDTAPPGVVAFYLVRTTGGSLGQSSGGLERKPQNNDCD